MRVQDIIEFLSEYPPETEIKFFSSVVSPPLSWLSDYMDDTNSFVCVDIGE